jgi:hypothetical protein
MKRKILLICCLLAMMPVSAMAQSTSYVRGGDLLSICRVESKKTEFCESYVAGIIDYHNMLRSLKTEPGVRFCIPARYTLTQVTEIVLRDLANSPQHDHFTAAPAVTLALFKAFPCRKRKK